MPDIQVPDPAGLLACVAVLSGKRWGFYLSMGLAAAGAPLCANGYCLIV